MTHKMMFDVESVGLHGEGFAVGFVVLDPNGVELVAGSAYCPTIEADGPPDDRAWVNENVSVNGIEFATPAALRDYFWTCWTGFKSEYPDLQLWTDCGWPVEANFLSACVADDPVNRKWGGPYPLFDLSTLLLAVGENPTGTFNRQPSEEPAHNALNDARQSARIMLAMTPPSAHKLAENR